MTHPHIRSRRLRRLLWPVTFALLTTPALAADLMDTWRLASANDPQLALAQAQRDQALVRRAQMAPLWEAQSRVTLAAGMGGQDAHITNARAMGQNGVDFDTSVNVGGLARASVGVQKPLRNAALEVQSQLLDLSARLGELQWAQAQQDLAWRVVQRHLDVVAARQTLALWQRQLDTLQKAEAEIVRRQRVGDASVMDVQEAQTRLATLRAAVLQAKNEVDLKSLAYRQLTGQPPAALSAPAASPMGQAPSDLPPWLVQARAQSLALQMTDVQIELQTQEARRIRVSGTTPTLDWVAQAQVDRLTGRGMAGGATQQMAGYLVGVQWSAPLGTHGLTDAREQEALKQVDRLQRDRDWQLSQLELQVSQAWHQWQSSVERLDVLAQALQVSQQRVRTTRQAHRLGTRSTLEWLGAEQDAVQAEMAWQQMRVQVVMARARLWWSSGRLSEAQLQEINQQLQ